MQLGSKRAVIPLPTAGPGQSHAGRPGKIDLYCFDHVKLSAA